MDASTTACTRGPIAAVSVARPVAALLHGAERPARVCGVYPRAAYLAGGDGLVALTARDAERLPFGVQVPLPARPSQPLLGLRAGAPATIGRGRLVLHGTAGVVTVVDGPRWDPRPAPQGGRWHPATVEARLADLQRLLSAQAPPDSLAPLARAADALLADSPARPWPAPPGPADAAAMTSTDHHAQIGAGLAAFARAARAHDITACEASARALIGLGPGLTPAADDALGGLLAAARFLARALRGDDTAWRAIGRAVRRAARGRTTAVSAALLGCATLGATGETAGAVLRALGDPEPMALDTALSRLLALGHTSGGDTALGILLGARLALERRPVGR